MTGPVTGARWWRVTHAIGAAYLLEGEESEFDSAEG